MGEADAQRCIGACVPADASRDARTPRLTCDPRQRTARKEQAEDLLETHEERARKRDQDLQTLAAKHDQQMAEVQKLLSALKLKQQSEMIRLSKQWSEQDKVQHERIERVIRLEEENHRAKLEAERKKREEEERQRKLEEERRLAEEEKKRQEEAQRRKQKEAEEAAQRAKDEAEREKRASQAAAEKRRNALGITSSEEDWVHARHTLKVSGTFDGHCCGV